MASKEDIISYVMKTPENTNPAILGNMLDSMGGGGIEMETVFDEDITFTYQKRQYGPTSVAGNKDGTISMLEGYLKITLDDIEARGTSTLYYVHINNEFVEYVGFEVTLNQYNLFLDDQRYTIKIQYIKQDQSTYGIDIYIIASTSNDDANLQTYCETPHHLKVEWFTI